MKPNYSRKNMMTGLTIPQNVERTGSDDRCSETSMRHNEDSGRNKHDNYRNGENNSESKHQQSNNKCDKYSQDIRESMISNSKQHGRLSMSSSKDVS